MDDCILSSNETDTFDDACLMIVVRNGEGAPCTYALPPLVPLSLELSPSLPALLVAGFPLEFSVP